MARLRHSNQAVDGADMEPIILVPLGLVAIFALAHPDRLKNNRLARYAVAGTLGFLVVRYMAWRIPVTVLPANRLDLQSALVWTLFIIECLAWLDAAILFAALCRRTDRSGEADMHETRLRAVEPEDLPEVDVLIATYNEPLDVLERTIIGAASIDWPPEKLKVWVLDDGRREFLRAYCAERRIGYLTRPDNAHAKAGNINAAIPRTAGEFFVVLDADFIPQRTILYRMIGFFGDPKVGIVQAPHRFFNHDPMQSNLALRRTLPGDQALFFDQIMPGRDGWDCAFCCGSNSITRRSAIQAIGNAMPSGSITEDMLLTLALLRQGYVTRYLNERLAIGLAPESLDAFFVQRARWAQGALQILYLREGPFGPGLNLIQRLMFLPTHWLTQSLTHVAAMSAPCIYLLTGLLPMANTTPEGLLSYQFPAILAAISALRFFAPGQYFPLAATVLGALQAFRLLPGLFKTLVRPYGHKFHVTPKGSEAGVRSYDRFTVFMATGLLAATALGFLLNSSFDARIISDVSLVPVVAVWCSFNSVVLLVVLVTAFSVGARRREVRFEMDEPVLIRREHGGTHQAQLRDISLGGMAASYAGADPPVKGDWLVVTVADVGRIAARVVHSAGGILRLQFSLPPSRTRDRVIRKVYTGGCDNTVQNDDALEITLKLLTSIFRDTTRGQAPPAPAGSVNAQEPVPPDWLSAEIAQHEADLAALDREFGQDAPSWMPVEPSEGGGRAA
ncbi:MAG: glycosyltransferase [Paracoccaceae bacterium]|nr:glycosyltransferase [Paracoccaceae bacterium]